MVKYTEVVVRKKKNAQKAYAKFVKNYKIMYKRVKIVAKKFRKC